MIKKGNKDMKVYINNSVKFCKIMINKDSILGKGAPEVAQGTLWNAR